MSGQVKSILLVEVTYVNNNNKNNLNALFHNSIALVLLLVSPCFMVTAHYLSFTHVDRALPRKLLGKTGNFWVALLLCIKKFKLTKICVSGHRIAANSYEA